MSVPYSAYAEVLRAVVATKRIELPSGDHVASSSSREPSVTRPAKPGCFTSCRAAGQFWSEAGELIARRQLTVEHQVGDLEVGRALGQLRVFFIGSVSCANRFADISRGCQRMRQRTGVDERDFVPTFLLFRTRTAQSRAPGATPTTPNPLSFAPMTPETAVPWPKASW